MIISRPVVISRGAKKNSTCYEMSYMVASDCQQHICLMIYGLNIRDNHVRRLRSTAMHHVDYNNFHTFNGSPYICITLNDA